MVAWQQRRMPVAVLDRADAHWLASCEVGRGPCLTSCRCRHLPDAGWSQILALEVALKSDSACAKPHLLAAAVPRQGHAIACDLLQPIASTSDQRNGLQLVKALGLGYLLPAGLV